MIQIKRLSKGFAGQELFSDISFSLSSGERLGIVGRNGCGKSTLFKIILGQMEADSGEVGIPKNYRIGYLEQHIHFSESSVLAEACKGLLPEEKFNHYKVEKILFGLGFKQDDMDRDPNLFSGGQQIRINLAKTLVADPHLLLLDEPTNYLDLPAIRWLVSFLKSFSGEIMLITHDRGFMDAVTTHTMGMYRQKIKKVKGPTSKLYEQIALEDEIHQKTLMNQQKKRKELEDFITRFKAKASKATQAQSRVKMLAKMGQMDEITSEQTLHLNFHYKDFPAKVIAEIKNLSFHYQDKEELISNLSFFIGKQDRIAIIGKNGKGKSTLLNLLGTELAPTQGEINYHSACEIGHFGQTNIDRLHGDNSIIQEVQSVNSDLSISKVRSICGAMLFTGELAEKKIRVLSGGERARVMLGKILAKEVNLLLLDEPTNHLDIQSIEILSMQLEQFAGAVLFVTHSEMLLRQVATKLIVFRQGRVELFDGTYDEFLTKIGWDEEDDNFCKEKIKENSSLSYKEKKQKRAELIKERNEQLRPLKKEFEELEHSIDQAESQKVIVEQQLLDASNRSDGGQIASCGQELAKLEQLIEQQMERYAEVGTLIEDIEDTFAKKIDQLDL